MELKSVTQAVAGGLREPLKRWPVLVVFYLANLAAAALAAGPLIALIASTLGHSLESERLFEQFDLSWIPEMMRTAGAPAGSTLGAVAALTGVLYLVASTFLSGGAIAVLLHPGQSSFASCARYFPRFARLLVWTLPCYAIVFAVYGGMGKAIAKFAENSMQAHVWIELGWLRMAIGLVLLLLVNGVADYAKIILVEEGRSGAFAALLDAFRFAIRVRSAMLVMLAVQALGGVLLLVYHGISEITPQTSLAGVFLLALIRQVYVAARLWLRLAGWSAGARFYETIRGPGSDPVITAPPENPLPDVLPAPDPEIPAEESHTSGKFPSIP